MKIQSNLLSIQFNFNGKKNSIEISKNVLSESYQKFIGPILCSTFILFWWLFSWFLCDILTVYIFFAVVIGLHSKFQSIRVYLCKSIHEPKLKKKIHFFFNLNIFFLVIKYICLKRKNANYAFCYIFFFHFFGFGSIFFSHIFDFDIIFCSLTFSKIVFTDLILKWERLKQKRKIATI